jgi:hypothetical protein
MQHVPKFLYKNKNGKMGIEKKHGKWEEKNS